MTGPFPLSDEATQARVDDYMKRAYLAERLGPWMCRALPHSYEATFTADRRTWLAVLDLLAADLRIYRAHASVKTGNLP